jgi:predicted branched-subunit amino acid permease
MAPVLRVHGLGRAVAAQLTIDESTAMAVGRSVEHDDGRASRLAFWATGLSVFVFWNLATLAGSLGASALGDPKVYGLDAAIPAGFIALVWPRLRDRRSWAVGLSAAAVALVLTPFVRPGVPVLLSSVVAVVAGVLAVRNARVGR